MIQLTTQDVAAAQALHLKRFLRRRLAITLILTVVFVALLLVPQLNPEGGGQLLRLGVAAVLTALLILALPFVLPPFVAPRLMRRHPALSRPFAVTPQDEGLVFQSDEGDRLVRWSDLVQLVQDDRVMLVYFTPVLFQILPKRAIPAGDVARISALFLQTHR